jgi:hypothetical protein
MHLPAAISKKRHSLYIGKKTDVGKKKEMWMSVFFGCRSINGYVYAFNMQDDSAVAFVRPFTWQVAIKLTNTKLQK